VNEYESALELLDQPTSRAARRECHLEFAQALLDHGQTDQAVSHFSAAAALGEPQPPGTIPPDLALPVSPVALAARM
jgi:hypothetical protein